MAKRSKRFPISLPPFHYKLLILWAHLKRTSRTSQCEKTLEARLEANESQILSGIAEEAADLGIPVDEHKAKILADAGFDVADFYGEGWDSDESEV